MPEVTRDDLDQTTDVIITSAIEVHRTPGPGLLESACQRCLTHELTPRSQYVDREREVAANDQSIAVKCGYRIDILVNNGWVVVQVKAVSGIDPIHEAQLLTHLRLGGWRVGLIINFNVPVLKYGLKRKVLGY